MIGTRPALNLLVARVGGAPARVASEHAAFWVYREPLQREIWRRYAGLDAVVVLGEPERAPLEAQRAVWVIPNAAPRCARRAGAAGGAGGGGGRAARGGEGLRPADPGVHRG